MEKELTLDFDPEVLRGLADKERTRKVLTARFWFAERDGLSRLLNVRLMSDEQLLACFTWERYEAGRAFGLTSPEILASLLHLSLHLIS